MKKLTALLLAIVMTLSLTGCIFRPEIVGTYQAEADLCEMVIEKFDSGTGLTDTNFSMKYYLKEFKILINFEFLKEGTYSITVDNASIQAALLNLHDAAVMMIDDYLFAAAKQEYTNYGFTLESRDDVAALVNMSWAELCTTARGCSLDEYVNQLITNSFGTALSTQYRCEGQFTARRGQLHLSDGLEAEPVEENYETYEIANGIITFTGSVNLEDNTFFSYPYVLTPVSLPTAA